MPVKEAEKEDEAENETNKKDGKEETTEASSSQPIEYYSKHRINEKLIEGLVGNHRLNDSLSRAQFRKIKRKTHNLSPRGPVYEAILRKKITRKEDIRGNFEIPCNIGGLKYMNTLVDQGSDVNVMPHSTYMKLTDERPTEMDIRLSLASHSYIYPLGIVEDILVEREMKFDQWKSKNFKSKHPALVKVEGERDDEGEVTLYLIRRSLEVLRKFHWMILGGRFNQLSHVSSPLLSKPGDY
ncbi:hypothetical protein Tco_1294606 [Tanacetum coccineum]